MKERNDRTSVALYARVSSDRQDVDLSVAAQLRALRDYAERNGYSIAREFVDEAESGRVADRPQFRKMLDEANKPNSPFREILVWKFSRFTRKREHAVAFKSMLRRKSIRVVSITEHADDSPTGKLMEAIIESVDEFYSENLAEEVYRGMREAASRGFWVACRVPYGYRKLMVQDGAKKRPTLELDPDTAPVVKRIFNLAEAGHGILDITRTLNDDGIANPTGRQWSKNGVHIILRNETYTGTLVWGTSAKHKGEPVRVDNAFPAIITKTQFRKVNRQLRARAPKQAHPRRVGSSYLLRGLVKCKACRRAMSGQDSKSGQFAYYVCQSLIKRGSGAYDAPRLNARRFEEMVVDRIRENILTESNIGELVRLVDEEMDGIAREHRQRLETAESELADVKRRLDRLYNLAETTDLDLGDFMPRIREHRERQQKLEETVEEARVMLSQRRVVLDDVNTITAYAQDMNNYLRESELTERRAFIESFVKEIMVEPDGAMVRYTIPMPEDSPIGEKDTEEMALHSPVLSTVKRGGPRWGRTCGRTARYHGTASSAGRAPATVSTGSGWMPRCRWASVRARWRSGLATSALPSIPAPSSPGSASSCPASGRACPGATTGLGKKRWRYRSRRARWSSAPWRCTNWWREVWHDRPGTGPSTPGNPGPQAGRGSPGQHPGRRRQQATPLS